MNQDQQPPPLWKDKWLVSALTALASLAIIASAGHLLGWTWTELIWRWLELLIIPLVLALGVLWFNRQERRAQNDIETRRQKSAQVLAQEERENDRAIAALQGYLDRMSELILDKDLWNSNTGDVVRDVARARTLAVLKDLVEDQEVTLIQQGKKSQVVRFLYEAGLISGVDEKGRNKAIVDLRKADLSFANLVNATLKGANLEDTNLTRAYLSYANLKGANLSNAILLFADLTCADLKNTDLTNADLGHANLLGAKNCTNQQLARAKHLDQAIMPGGTRMTQEEEFKERNSQ